MSRLIAVSNRVALPGMTRAGGLTAALLPALSESGGLWFGWSGALRPKTATDLRLQKHGRIDYALIDLGRRDYDDYYLGFANRTLWPLFHFRLGLVDYSRRHYAGYLRVNRLFARKLIELVRDDDTIWVHDYHLIPLAAELRALGCGARIGFFLHIPLPPADLLVALPEHRHLLATFSAYDLVGFHTESYRRAFEDYFRHEARASVDGDRITTSGGRRFRVGVFPIGIDTAGVAAAAANAAGSAATRELVESLQGRRLIIGVDRLDYSKGLPGRFKALGQFLAAHPDQHGQVSLLQIAPPSREEVIEYRRLRAQLERVAGAVNGRYARPDWVPIRYVNNSYDLDTLAGFYRSADVGLVTPLRDGMNLVAKEFIASQESAAPGVLILSRFAGAVHELTGALVVNPFDSEDISEAIARALAMPLPERRERWRAQMNVLERNDVNAWRSAYLGALAEGSESRQPLATAQVA